MADMKRKDMKNLNKRIKPPAVLIEKNIFLDLFAISIIRD
jgi:hypothetical protein